MAGSNLVELISASDPQLLSRLLEKYPAAAKLLETSTTRKARGGTPETAEAERSLTDAKIDLLLKGIGPVQKELGTIIEVVKQKMLKVKRIKLLGAVVATLSGLAIAILEASDFGQAWVKVVSAGFATVGGLVVILSDYFAQAPSGEVIASAEEYGKLDQIRKELSKVASKVQRHTLYPLNEEDIDEMMDSLDEYAAHINGLTLKTRAGPAET